MKILYVYLSGKGYVQEFAKKKGDELKDEVTLVNLRKEKCPPLNDYDACIVSSSIKAGRIPKKIVKFLESHQSELKNKKALFLLSCMEEKEETHRDYLKNNLSDKVQTALDGTVWIGGRIDFAQYNFLIRTMLKKINGNDTEEIITKENPKAMEQIKTLLK